MRDKSLKIIQGFKGYKEGTICYQTGSSPMLALEMGHHIYEDTYHQIPLGPSAIKLFYERLMLGEQFPPDMIISDINQVDIAFASAMFINPNIILQPDCAPLVYSTEMFLRLGIEVASAHMPCWHKAVLLETSKTLAYKPNDTIEKLYQRLYAAISVIENYLMTGCIDIPEMPEMPYEILYDTGSFIAFEGKQAPMEEIYRQGYLAGIWYEPVGNLYRPHIFKKSKRVNMDLNLIGEVLNVEEFGIIGKNAGWLEGGDGATILHCPTKDLTTGKDMVGTKLSKARVLELVLTFPRKLNVSSKSDDYDRND